MRGAWRGLDAIPRGFGPSVVTVGNFDGVHVGHQKILTSAAGLARRGGMASVALTFDPHPLRVVAPAQAPQALTGIAHRVGLIREQGVDQVAVLPFTHALSRLSPLEFAEQVLAGKLAAKTVVVGANFRFGCAQAGDVLELSTLGGSLGFDVEVVDTVVVGGEAVSSTRLRGLVREGRVEEARRLLGREFSLQGRIERGEGIGAKRTVPTLNLAPDSEVLPADGVYLSLTCQVGQTGCHESITNVGMRPTFEGRRRTVETYVLGGLGATPPKAIELRFLRKIRDERKFPSAKLLLQQIQADIEVAARYFQRLRAQSAGSSVNP